MKIVFQKHYVRVKSSYQCKCGHKFKRINSDWFTNSPFNQKSSEECRQEMTQRLAVVKKVCPKCKADCKPTSANK